MSIIVQRQKVVTSGTFQDQVLANYPNSVIRFGWLSFVATIRDEEGQVLAQERGAAVSLAVVRVMLWAGLFLMGGLPLWAEAVARAAAVPPWLSFFSVLALVAIVGHQACGWMIAEAPRQYVMIPLQIVRQQRRTRATTVASLARAYWGVVWLTPWIARIVSFWPWAWFSYGNRPVKMAEDALLNGLSYVLESKKEDFSDWQQQSIFDQSIQSAESFTKESTPLWARTARIQETIYIIGFFIGFVGTAVTALGLFMGQ